jgi:hypothetical protein
MEGFLEERDAEFAVALAALFSFLDATFLFCNLLGLLPLLSQSDTPSSRIKTVSSKPEHNCIHSLQKLNSLEN